MTRALLLAILRILHEIHAGYDPHESEMDWSVRADQIAQAIVETTANVEEISVVLGIIEHESHAALEVHRGKITRWKGQFTRGMMQVDKRYVPEGVWSVMGSSDMAAAAMWQVDAGLTIWRENLHAAKDNTVKAHQHYMGARNPQRAKVRDRRCKEIQRRIEAMIREVAA